MICRLSGCLFNNTHRNAVCCCCRAPFAAIESNFPRPLPPVSSGYRGLLIRKVTRKEQMRVHDRNRPQMPAHKYGNRTTDRRTLGKSRNCNWMLRPKRRETEATTDAGTHGVHTYNRSVLMPDLIYLSRNNFLIVIAFFA